MRVKARVADAIEQERNAAEQEGTEATEDIASAWRMARSALSRTVELCG
jgi:hypothetical protein